jgi:5-formyltetrahydrofolate cyclo-ligase
MTKKRFRKIALSRLKKLSNATNRYKLDKMIIARLKRVIKAKKPKSIMLFIPLKIEPDIKELLKICRKKITLFVPIMEGKSLKMVKYRLPLKEAEFKIKEPKNSTFKPKRVDMIVVPVVGVDGGLRRVGFGKGFYDRFYATLNYKPITLFIQRDFLYTHKHLCDDFDIECDFYITPKKTVKRNDI